MSAGSPEIKALVIDDDPDDAFFLSSILTSFSPLISEVKTVLTTDHSGNYLADKQEYLKKGFLLVICDIHLCGAYGPGHLRDIKEVFPNASLVAVSGVRPEDDFFELYPEIDCFMQKSGNLDLLRFHLSQVIHKMKLGLKLPRQLV